MMRFVRTFLSVVSVVVIAACTVFAEPPSYQNGEVIYHQDFAELSDFQTSEIKIGTSSSDGTLFTCTDGVFSINTSDGGRSYAILPRTDWTDSFTVEVTFSFTEKAQANGYLAVMLTSSGDEPGNISQIVFRAKGTVDDFASPSDALSEAIRSGAPIQVTIPVENNAVQTITVSSGGITEELQRNSLLLIGAGSRGFSARNVGVDISEIFIVNGVDYTEKIGRFAEESYASTFPDTESEQKPEGTPPAEPDTAPETGDTVVSAAVAAAGCMFFAVKRARILEK